MREWQPSDTWKTGHQGVSIYGSNGRGWGKLLLNAKPNEVKLTDI